MDTPAPTASQTQVLPASARPKLTASKKPNRRAAQFGFTVRLSADQLEHFEALAVIQGHRTVAAAFKAQALATGHEHPLREMRLSLEHMQARITDDGAGLQERILHLSRALDSLQRNVEDMVCEMQTCTQAMLLFAQTNEALTHSFSSLQIPDGRRPKSSSANLSPQPPRTKPD